MYANHEAQVIAINSMPVVNSIQNRIRSPSNISSDHKWFVIKIYRKNHVSVSNKYFSFFFKFIKIWTFGKKREIDYMKIS